VLKKAARNPPIRPHISDTAAGADNPLAQSKDPPMPDNRELEIKMRLDPADVEKIASSDTLKGINLEHKHYRTVYFDGKRHELARHGFELRIRDDGTRRIQTLKSVNGLDRGEWETEAASGVPSLDEISGTPAADLIRHCTKLIPVFSLQIDRRSWTVLRDGAAIEVALDTGFLTAGSRSQPIYEVEFELKEGPPKGLFELAEDMKRQFDAPLSFQSKGGRGYNLASGGAFIPPALHLTAALTTKTAFQKIANACLRQFSFYEEDFRATGDAEALHQARIAIRRLRAAFSMFKTVVTGKDADEVREGLKWISDLLGRPRDLDVFVEVELRRIDRQHPGVPGLSALVEKVSSMRRAAHDHLKEALHSVQFRQMLLSLALCIQAGEWTHEGAAGPHEERLIDFARAELGRRLKSVAKGKKAVAGDDALQRHRVRIKAKKLRYMAGFLQSLASGKAYARTMRRLKLLQDHLGMLNDVIAGERLLSQAVSEAQDASVSFAASLVCQYSAVPRKIAKEAAKVHKKLRQSRSFSVSL